MDLSHYVFGDPATPQGQGIGEISIEVLFGFIESSVADMTGKVRR